MRKLIVVALLAGCGQPSKTEESTCSTSHENLPVFVELNPDFFNGQGGAVTPTLTTGQSTAGLVIDFSNHGDTPRFLRSLRLHQEANQGTLPDGDFAYPSVLDQLGNTLGAERSFVGDVAEFVFDPPLTLDTLVATSFIFSLRVDENSHENIERIYFEGPGDFTVKDSVGADVEIRGNNGFPLSSAEMQVKKPQPYFALIQQATAHPSCVAAGAINSTLIAADFWVFQGDVAADGFVLRIVDASMAPLVHGKHAFAGRFKITIGDATVLDIAAASPLLYGGRCEVIGGMIVGECDSMGTLFSFDEAHLITESAPQSVMATVDVSPDADPSDGYILIVQSVSGKAMRDQSAVFSDLYTQGPVLTVHD